jgi:hypothetical protein
VLEYCKYLVIMAREAMLQLGPKDKGSTPASSASAAASGASASGASASGAGATIRPAAQALSHP